jgi:hypothetical protein
MMGKWKGCMLYWGENACCCGRKMQANAGEECMLLWGTTALLLYRRNVCYCVGGMHVVVGVRIHAVWEEYLPLCVKCDGCYSTQ